MTGEIHYFLVERSRHVFNLVNIRQVERLATPIYIYVYCVCVVHSSFLGIVYEVTAPLFRILYRITHPQLVK